MINIDDSSWFVEFTYNGEVKRIHRFAHLPMDFVLENKGGADVSAIFDKLLQRDCGMRLADLDAASAKMLIDELSSEGVSLGE